MIAPVNLPHQCVYIYVKLGDQVTMYTMCYLNVQCSQNKTKIKPNKHQQQGKYISREQDEGVGVGKVISNLIFNAQSTSTKLERYKNESMRRERGGGGHREMGGGGHRDRGPEGGGGRERDGGGGGQRERWGGGQREREGALNFPLEEA